MPKTILLLLTLVAMTWPLSAATAAKRTTSKHRAPAAKTTTAAKHTTATKHTATARTGAKPTASRRTTSKSKRHVASRRRSYQQTPTPERYKEIQQAMASKGYFQGEVNGEWKSDSVDALKRFQAEQNLTPDGKLSALSLIALGLGPKHTPGDRTPAEADSPKADQPK